jgi:ferredoxin
MLVAWLWHPKAVSAKFLRYGVSLAALGLLAGFVLLGTRLPPAPLQIGLLDPIPLVYRSINLILLPLAENGTWILSATPRHYDGSWLMGAIFVGILLLSVVIPRFFCRFVCPLGALFGFLVRFALWRIGKGRAECRDCHLCEKNCEGACEPSTRIRLSECVLCLNCLNDCHHGLMTYQTRPSAAGESSTPDLTRRALVTSLVSGAVVVPMLRLNANLATNWNPQLVRPPGALPEPDFLARCIKCGQCMRICPTNVIHPAGLEVGLEGLWTPMLNFRIGSSGCQVNCIACGNLCPTAAIRPISLAERRGTQQFAEQGPIRIGTAFVDPGRCLPWAMDKPCIVCQENCPVSPKAIFTREIFNPIRPGPTLSIQASESSRLEFGKELLPPGQYATGDYFCTIPGSNDQRPRKIVRNTADSLELAPDLPFESPPPVGSQVILQIRLQRPYVDPQRCIGCGVCEHECPVPGKRAIRVTADNESRNRNHALLL